MSSSGTARELSASIMPSTGVTRSNLNASQEPPAKRPRLKLNLRKPSSNDGDTIAVSRPKRASAARSRYSEEAIESDDEVEGVKAEQSPAASSGLSSPMSEPASVKDEVPPKDAKTGGKESYGDFMSYYITGGDESEEDAAPAPVAVTKHKPESARNKPAAREKQQREKQPRKPRAKKEPAALVPVSSANSRAQPTGQPSHTLPPRPNSRQSSIASHLTAPRPTSIQPQAHPTARPLVAARPPVMPVPMSSQMPPQRPVPEPPILEEITVKYHASVQNKVEKLQALSAALTNFGGVPPANKTPFPADEKKDKKVEKKIEAKKQLKKQADQDGECQQLWYGETVFINDLAGEAPVDNFLAMFDDESSSGEDGDIHPETEDRVEEPRYLDHTGEPDGPLTYGIQFIMNALKSWAQQRLQQQHLAAVQQASMPPPASPNAPPSANRPSVPRRLSLGDTPEGQAIAAFRDVVESGCLQVNVVMPADLAAAVRHLYVQIDQLINQGSKAPPEPWQPMSYSAQMKAHQMRVDRWRDQQARAEQALQRPHPLFPMQHGMPPPHMLNGHSHQLPHPYQMHDASDRRRSTPHIPGQPHAGPPTRVSLPAGFNGPSPSPVNGYPAGTPPIPQGGASRPDLPHDIGDMTLEERARLMQTGNYRLPRSGQTMTFSFAPENPAALQAFGPGAFPAMNQDHGPNIPNRGPMSASPVVKSSPAIPTPERPASKGELAKPKSEHDLRGTNGSEPHAHPARTLKPSSGFTAVNAPAKPATDSRPASASGPKSPGLSRSDAVVLDD